MLVIRDAQIEALEEAIVVPRYEASMLAHLRRYHAAALAGTSNAVLLGQVRALTIRARSYGAADAADCSEFVELAMSIGLEFDHEPWAFAVLAGGGANATSWADKVAALLALLTGDESAVPMLQA
jgi:hypothetical protein